MAYYFLFPESDSTIYSHPDRSDLNTGGDEILELLKERGATDTYNYPTRILMKFKDEEIKETIDLINEIPTGNPVDNFNKNQTKVSFQLISTDAKKLVSTNVLSIFAVSQSWNEGRGKYHNFPTASSGVTWNKRDNSINATSWSTTNFAPYTTGSISSSILTQGGGVWYTGSDFTSTQQFLVGENLDTDIDITSIALKWSASLYTSQTYPNGILNNGVILKLPESIETNADFTFGEVSYFSNNTHTIYPPKLAFKWDDSINLTNNYDIGSRVLSGSVHVSLYNNKNEYNQNDEVKFRFHIRDKYPTRTFSTSSNYLVNRRFKSGKNSLYSIRDAHTEQEIIPFDEDYTKLSHDGESSFFKLYMKGLQPERYYRILIKHLNDDGITIYDDNYYFKVVR